jgi:hypothetical protein
LPISKRTFVFVVLAFTVWAVTATAFTGYYYLQYRQLEDTLKTMQSLVLKVNVLVNYGNGTKEWHNNTLVPAGSTVFNVTVAIAEVDYSLWNEYVLIDAINGLQGTKDIGWIWWIWDPPTSEWKQVLEAANKHVLVEGDTIGWNYQSWASTEPPS